MKFLFTLFLLLSCGYQSRANEGEDPVATYNLTNVNKLQFEFASDEPTECRLDSMGDKEFVPCSSPFPVKAPAWADGYHLFEARTISDKVIVSRQTILIDTTAPIVTFAVVPKGPMKNSDAAVFNFKMSESSAKVACYVDDLLYTPCRPSQNLKIRPFKQSPGPHVFKVVVTDAAGNSSAVTHRWEVETDKASLKKSPSKKTKAIK